MIEVRLVEKSSLYDSLKQRLSELILLPFEIKKTGNGKPYIEGDPLFFSVTHSGDVAAFAICDKPVGIDLELFKGKPYPSVLSRFSERERSEIESEEDFLRHWTAREAFIKMNGGTLATYFKRLEFYCGEIYFDGKKCGCEITFRKTHNGVMAICVQGGLIKE